MKQSESNATIINPIVINTNRAEPNYNINDFIKKSILELRPRFKNYEIAHKLGISTRTLYRYCTEFKI